jgi:hypothetical protein
LRFDDCGRGLVAPALIVPRSARNGFCSVWIRSEAPRSPFCRRWRHLADDHMENVFVSFSPLRRVSRTVHRPPTVLLRLPFDTRTNQQVSEIRVESAFTKKWSFPRTPSSFGLRDPHDDASISISSVRYYLMGLTQTDTWPTCSGGGIGIYRLQ